MPGFAAWLDGFYVKIKNFEERIHIEKRVSIRLTFQNEAVTCVNN